MSSLSDEIALVMDAVEGLRDEVLQLRMLIVANLGVQGAVRVKTAPESTQLALPRPRRATK